MEGTKRHIIVLGGKPGSGKSTVRNILKDELGYEMFSTGDFTRKMAIAKGVTLEDFNAGATKELDELIDAELTAIEASKNNIIVDSHLAFHFVPSAFKVFFDITLDESAKRIFGDAGSELRRKSGDTMETIEEAYERTEKRILNHQKRYMEHYGIDPYDPSKYDVVIDTSTKTPREVATMIIDAYNAWLSE